LAGWRYELGPQKLRELSVALGQNPDRENVPAAAVFMYALQPALGAILVDPAVAGRRASLALTSVAARWHEQPSVGVELEAEIEVEVSPTGRVVGRAACLSEGRSICEVEIALDDPSVEPGLPREPQEGQARLRIDGARALAFAAATWDLAPVYWDRDFAAAVGLDGPIAPPGLVAAWLANLVETRAGRVLTELDVRFQRTPRVGEEAVAYLAGVDPVIGSVWSKGLPAVSGTFLTAPVR
jgi:hypothetical protein